MKYGAYRSIPRHVASGSERLEYLASFLEGASPERVTFSRWYGSGKGCAVGLAAVQEPRIRRIKIDAGEGQDGGQEGGPDGGREPAGNTIDIAARRTTR